MCMPETKMSAQGTQLVNANPSSNTDSKDDSKGGINELTGRRFKKVIVRLG